MKQQTGVLVLGGTGMLLPAVLQLQKLGHRLLVVSRHASECKRLVAPAIIPVDADWRLPAEYISRCRAAAKDFAITGLIVWVHNPYRQQIYPGIAQLLEPGSRVVRVWGSSGNPRHLPNTAPGLSSHNLCDVFLGANVDAGKTRWLSHEQISAGVVNAFLGEEQAITVGSLEY